jgi:hypothetical protein
MMSKAQRLVVDGIIKTRINSPDGSEEALNRVDYRVDSLFDNLIQQRIFSHDKPQPLGRRLRGLVR